MTDPWEHAAKSIREAMLDWTRRHRPDYVILARTAWDEEWDAEACMPTFNEFPSNPCFAVERELLAISRDPVFIEAGKR